MLPELQGFDRLQAGKLPDQGTLNTIKATGTALPGPGLDAQSQLRTFGERPHCRLSFSNMT
jgi:hypothetical protein